MNNSLIRFLVNLNPANLLKLLGIHEFAGPSSMPFPINKFIEALCLEGIFTLLLSSIWAHRRLSSSPL